MRKESIEVEDRFYARCAELLGTTHRYIPWPCPTRGPNRWNNRHAGNGRYPGFGTIHMYGPNNIHVSLRHPRIVNRTFKDVEDVFEFLRSLRPDQD